MKKAVVFGLLILVTGFFLWQMIIGVFFNPAEDLAAGIDKEDFDWFTCASCGRLFMAEVTTRKGYCPYCKFQMMLITEDKRVFGRGAGESEFIWFFSPQCGKVFFAFATEQPGACPYCAEPLDLAAPFVAVAANGSNPLRAYAGKLFWGSLGLFAISIAGIYILLENRTVLSLEPIEGAVSKETKIVLSKWQTRKKKLTLGGAPDDDIVLNEPSLKDVRCVLSFVRVGGKTHAYLSRGSNKPILVNEKPEYNPRLHNHDKIKLGDVVFEVNTRDK